MRTWKQFLESQVGMVPTYTVVRMPDGFVYRFTPEQMGKLSTQPVEVLAQDVGEQEALMIIKQNNRKRV